MGLDRFQKTPCGFCFVEYQTHQQAVDCMRFINGTKLDERLVRTDLDPGFKEGRQYGRGRSGGQVSGTLNSTKWQVRDEYRKDYDPSRGGWGKLKAEQHGGRALDEPYEEIGNFVFLYGDRLIYQSRCRLSGRGDAVTIMMTMKRDFPLWTVQTIEQFHYGV